MNRNCLFNKAIALLLCAFMLVGFLPSTVFTAAADESNDQWEGEWDIVETTTEEPAPGSTAETAILLTELENSLTVEAGATVYYQGQFSGMNMAVTGTTGYNIIIGEEITADVEGTFSTAVVTEGPRYPFVFAIQNNTAEAVEYSVNFTYPEGSMENPEEIGLDWDYETAIAAGSQGYYYSYPAEKDGLLQITISTAEGLGWQYVVNNVTTSAYGEHQYSNSDPVVNPYELEVTTGDEIVIFVNTFDPANEWTAPEGNVTVRVEYKPGSAANPIMLQELENTVTVPAGETVYYQGYFSGMNMAVNGNNGTVIYGENGENEAEADGTEIPVSSPNPRMPVVFAIKNEGETDAEFTVNFTYPLGNMDNPATAVLGTNSCNIAAGSQGYYWTYTATEAGTLQVTITSEGDWTYVVNNMTIYAYGEAQWSDSDPVVNPYELEVAVGDQIQIVVNTYDPENMWSNPEGTISFNLAYEVVGPIVDENLTFFQKSLSFAEYISIQPALYTSAVSNYESFYVEAVQVTADSGEITTVLEPIDYTVYGFYAYDMQLLPRAMCDKIIFTVHAMKDGVEYIGVPVETSIEELALSMIKSKKDSDLPSCKILVDMLNYGAAVKTRFGYDSNNLPNKNLGEYAALGTAETPVLTATESTSGSGTVAFLSNSLSLGSKVEVQLAFPIGSVAGCELRYSINGVEEVIPASEFDSESLAAYGMSVAIFAVKPRNFRDPITYALYNSDGEPVTVVYTTSIEAFANKFLGGANNDVAIAMMKYGDAVIAKYVNK